MNLNLDLSTEAAANLTAIIDELGVVKAQIADLAKREKALKEIVSALGDGAYEGALFRAAVSSTDRETLDMKAVREKLSPQFIAAHTNITRVVTVKVSARNGKDVS